MEGTLYKLGGFSKNSYQQRYFVLKSSSLSWYKKRGDSKCQGKFSVRGGVLTKYSGAKNGKQNAFALQPAQGKSSKGSKSYIFAADTEQIRDQWIEAMNSAQGAGKLTIRTVGGGKTTSPSGNKPTGNKKKCKRCNVELGPKVVGLPNSEVKYHRECFNCMKCGTDCITGYQLHEDEIHCVPCKSKITKAAIAKQQKATKSGGGGGGGSGVTSSSPKYGKNPKWPECFRCQGPCKPGYLIHGKNYCELCHTQFDKHGACERCGELCDGNYLKVGFDHRYHKKCFTCKGCDRSLEAIGYRNSQQQIWCLECAPTQDKKLYKEKKKDFSTKVDWTQALTKSQAGGKLKEKEPKYECDYGSSKPESSSPKSNTKRRQRIFCPECGTKRVKGKFCKECGFNMDS